jgi:cytochrome c
MTNRTADTIGLIALLVVFLAILAAVFASVPRRNDAAAEQLVPNSDPEKGPAAIAHYGCGTCHMIPGVPGANGVVGPHLDNVAGQSFIAGMLANNPDNLVQWIMHPQELHPGVDMPDMGVTQSDARNIAAYLYSLH